MPKYRIFYIERTVDPRALYRYYNTPAQSPESRWRGEQVHQANWEEEIEASNAVEALETFFREHAGGRDDVLRLDHELGKGIPIDSFRGYETDETYLWTEDDKLMEYEGIEAMTFGRTICPLCQGRGGIDHALADYYFAGADGDDEARS